MKFSYPSIVRFSECGKNGRLSVPAIVNYMQDCSAMQSDWLGIGTNELIASGRAWFVIGWNIQIYERPEADTKIRVWTWATHFAGIYGERCMQITNEMTGEVYAECAALYVFMNLTTMHPTKAEGPFVLGYKTSPALTSVKKSGRKLPVIGEQREAGTFVVRRHDTDAYGHMNNARYVFYASDCLPAEFETGRLQVEYKISAREGDVVHLFTSGTDTQFEVEMRGEDGQIFARILYTKKGEDNDSAGKDAETEN